MANASYIRGNVITKDNVVEEMNKDYRTVDVRIIRNREKTKRVNFGYTLFITAALFAMGITLISFIKTKSELTIATGRVASMESELNDLKLTNDEELERIEASVNLEEIKQIAVEELGMTYAKEGQVITISDEGSDYVRQMEELPRII